jgi:hypothetical protein
MLGSGGTAATISNFGTRWRWVVSFDTLAALPPEKERPLPIEHEAVWSLEPAWTLWRREKSLSLAGNRAPAVDPEVRRFTDWAVGAPCKILLGGLNQGKWNGQLVWYEGSSTTGSSRVNFILYPVCLNGVNRTSFRNSLVVIISGNEVQSNS